MYVYLKFGTEPGDVKVVSNVSIGEDCDPIVNGQLIHDSTKTEESSATGSIDAVCWFKSLPMQAVFIDCSTRDARWCLKSVTIPDCSTVHTVQLRRSGASCDVDTATVPSTARDGEENTAQEASLFMPESARPLFSEHQGMSDFNPIIDEMFERVERLCLKWDVLTESGQINNEVARILHCYVFPAVTFLKEDLPALQQCLRLIVAKHDNINQEILTRKKSIDVTDGYLARLKEVILAQGEMTSQTYLQACSRDFVGAFYARVTKDVQSRNAKLDLLQTKVNDLKAREPAGGEPLTKLKAARDALHVSVQSLLLVREAIRDHLYRPFVTTKKGSRKHRRRKIDEKDASLHTTFQRVHEQLLGDKDQLKRLCYRKLHLASVREALESTLRTLRGERPSSFGDFTEFSISSSSSAAAAKKKKEGGGGAREEEEEEEWKSMQARVDGWMAEEGDLRRMHRQGCQMIVDVMESLVSDASLTGVVDAGQAGGALRCGYNGDISQDVSSQRAPVVKAVSRQALTYMWDVAEAVARRAKLDAAPGSRHLNRAWMCYDPHFWGAAGEAIEKIYGQYHASAARAVHQRASSAALADIMDSRFFRKLVTAGATAAAVTAEPPRGEVSSVIGRLKSKLFEDSLAGLSLDLQRCSVTDLYALANRDGAQASCHLLDLEDLLSSRLAESPGSAHSVSSDELSNAEKGENGGSSGRGSDTSAESGVSNENGARGSRRGSSCSPAAVTAGGSRVLSSRIPGEEDTSGGSPAGAGGTAAAASVSLLRGSQTVTSVLGVFEVLVEPYHEKVREVLKAATLMEKLRAVWQSVDFLSRKTQEVCQDKGMDALLPMSIFATASLPEDLFVRYFLQLLVLLDFRPAFALHSIYDFSLASAVSTFMFLFEAQFSGKDGDGGYGC